MKVSRRNLVVKLGAASVAGAALSVAALPKAFAQGAPATDAAPNLTTRFLLLTFMCTSIMQLNQTSAASKPADPKQAVVR